MKKLAAVFSAAAFAATLGVSVAEAGGRGGFNNGSRNDTSYNNVGSKIHINQNGNGCRNRCYYDGGNVSYNAGWNNVVQKSLSVRGHAHGHSKHK